MVAAFPCYHLVSFNKGCFPLYQSLATLLGFLKVFRLLRLGRVARKIDKYLEYGASTFFLLMLSFCLVAHWMACLFYLIATSYDNYEPHGWLQLLGRQLGDAYQLKNGTDKVDPNTGPTLPSKYVSALYYTLTSLTTIGFGNIAPNTTAEKLFGCVTMLLGCKCCGFFFYLWKIFDKNQHRVKALMWWDFASPLSSASLVLVSYLICLKSINSVTREGKT